MTGQLPPYGAVEFADALQAHLPSGLIWPRDEDATQRKVALALAPTYARNWETAQDLLVDAFPATAEFLLPEWEASLGLPDPCAGEDQTVAQRQAHVVARLTQTDGPTIASLTAYAATLGYTITITEYAPARAGLLRAGQPLYGTAWAFAWLVTAPQITVNLFRAGSSHAGELLETYGNTALICELRRLAPAHTVLMFTFGS